MFGGGFDITSVSAGTMGIRATNSSMVDDNSGNNNNTKGNNGNNNNGSNGNNSTSDSNNKNGSKAGFVIPRKVKIDEKILVRELLLIFIL